MDAGAYRIRTMTRQQVATAVEWAAAEGWNPGLGDAECFYATDPGGFLVGLLDDTPIATISVVRYGASFGFLGLYIVDPPHRGRGYGLRLWNAGLAHLAGRTIGLDGVVAQQANYRKAGFTLAYRNIRYRGGANATDDLDSRIVPLSSLPFEAVNEYDRVLFGADRRAFLQCWMAERHGKAIGLVRNGELAGYGVIRAARAGRKIGPLFADDPEVAAALFDGLVAGMARDAPVYLDTPQANADAVALAQRQRMEIVFETARMYTGVAPRLPLQRIYGVTTFELG
jgi:GNAT superfamily N-acetyltransferase